MDAAAERTISVEAFAPGLVDVKRIVSPTPFVAEGNNVIDVGASPAEYLSLFVDTAGVGSGNRVRVIADIAAVQHNTTGGSSYFDLDIAGNTIPGVATGESFGFGFDVCKKN